MRNLSRFNFFTIALGYILLWGIIYLILGLNGWQGEQCPCTPTDPCFCEAIDMNALIREKNQTWSNLWLILSGLIILFLIEFSNHKTSLINQNPMSISSLYSILYGFLTINIGIGSFWFHGSLLRYAEFMDTFAMNMYILFLLYYNITRLAKKSEIFFLILFIPTVILVGITEWMINNGNISVWIFSTFAGIGMTFETIVQLLMHLSRKYLKWITRDWKWFVTGIGSFFISFLIWNLSLPNQILCDPNSWIQGHAFWHLGVALSTFFLYIYCKSEKIIDYN